MMAKKEMNILEPADNEINTKDNTYLCTCGRMMLNMDCYDTLGSDSGICCPDCGNENFILVDDLLSLARQYLSDVGTRISCLIGERDDDLLNGIIDSVTNDYTDTIAHWETTKLHIEETIAHVTQ